MSGRISLGIIAREPAPVPIAPVEPLTPRSGPLPGRVRLPPRPAPQPRPEPPPLVLPERRPNLARAAVVVRERREREAHLQGIARRRERAGLAPLGICAGVPTPSRVQHVEDLDPTVSMLLGLFPGSTIVPARVCA